jgi:metacaspase-1
MDLLSKQCTLVDCTNMSLSTGQPLFSWRGYFVACWSRSKALYLSVNSSTSAFRALKAFVLEKLGRLFGRWLSPRGRKKALLIGIRYDEDPNTETLTGPHQDVFLFRQLLIGECCHLSYMFA